MTPHQRLASASLAAAVALVVAACGSMPGSATNPPADPATSPQADPATSPPADPAPEVNSNFPYKPGGVTYFGDVGGGVLTFSIPAGTYSLNVQASYDPANDPNDSGQCLFSGELDYLSGSGGTAPLGGNAPVTSWVPFTLGPLAGGYGAGDYKIYIYPETTCSWTVELWP